MATYQNTEQIEMTEIDQRPSPRPGPSRMRDPRGVPPSTLRIDPRRALARDASGRLPPNRTVRPDPNLLYNMPLYLRAQSLPQSNDSDCCRQRRLEICLLLFAVVMAILLLIFLIAVTFRLIAKMDWPLFSHRRKKWGYKFNNFCPLPFLQDWRYCRILCTCLISVEEFITQPSVEPAIAVDQRLQNLRTVEHCYQRLEVPVEFKHLGHITV